MKQTKKPDARTSGGRIQEPSQNSKTIQKSDQKINAALDYAKKKYPVFPVKAKGKSPLVREWQNVATTDPEQIKKWWRQWPDANIGILTGRKSGIAVLDIDKKPGGFESLKKIEREHGPLPKTLRAKTGGGGLHYFFRYPDDGFKTSVRRIAAGIDTRGDNGYVVVPPSVHASGRQYCWQDAKPGGIELASVPPWILELLNAPKQPAGNEHGKIKEGGRNEALTSMAGKLRHVRLEQPPIEAALLAENKTKCNPPLPEEEVKKIAASVARYPKPATIPELMKSSEVAALTKDSPAESIISALDKFQAIVGNRDTLWVKGAQDALIKKLKSIKFSAPAATVHAMFKIDALAEGEGQGQAVLFPDVEPWPEPVDGAKLMDEIREIFERFIVLPDGASIALALWVLHTYAIEAAHHSPFIFLKSPEKRCGKSTVLKLLSALANRPLPTGSISPAALYRSVEKFEPTLLIDEADRTLKYDDEITGVLNASHDRGSAFVIRTSGDDHEPRIFRVFGPKAVAGIGRLADTIEDRAIILNMRRRAPGESVGRLRGDKLCEFGHIKEKAVRWIADNLEILKEIDPKMPSELNDRSMDNWRPLLAIAGRLGGEWPRLARDAAKTLSGGAEGEDSVGVQLLEDIKAFFEEEDSERISSESLAKHLVDLEGRPWPEWRHGKPISATGIARLLKKFRIKPKQFRDGYNKERGYLLKDFQDSFSRYLLSSSIPSGTTGTLLKNKELEGNPTGTENKSVPDGKANNSLKNNYVPVVPDGNRGKGGKKEKTKQTEFFSENIL